MACGLGRLGALLIPADVDEREDLLVEALSLLASVPSPRGRERALAEAVVAFASDRWPGARWSVQDVDGTDCAQVVGEAGAVSDDGGLLLYSHLDTSLTGADDFDLPVTGAPAAGAGPLLRDGRTLRGFGLGVAKAPAAAALVAFGTAANHAAATGSRVPSRLLLAARGTHRAPFGAVGQPPAAAALTGIERYLRDAPTPTAAVVAKGGPAGVLHDEPGAAYLRVTFRSGWGAVMAKDALRPAGGVLAHLGVLMPAVADVGGSLARLLAQRSAGTADGQAGACFGIGAIRGGQPTKADLVPGIVEVFGYLVAPGSLDVERVRTVFEEALREAVGDLLDGVDLEVEVRVIHAGASTPPDARVVRAAAAAWEADAAAYGALSAPTVVSGWTGSTDGVVLRTHGVPTARLGPSRTRHADGVDVVDLDELLAFSRVYERLLPVGNQSN